MDSVVENREVSTASKQQNAQQSGPSNVEISYVYHEDFDRQEVVHEILETLPTDDGGNPDAEHQRLQGMDYRLPNRPLLDASSERSLFRRMNLLRHMASRRQKRLAFSSSEEVCRRIVKTLLAEANELRNEILEANQRLVVSNASKFLRSGVPMADLVSEANVVLVKAVDGFDFSRGFRLSTYATYAIRRHLSRYVQREQKRAPMLSDDKIEPLIDDDTAEWVDLHPADLVRDIMNGLSERDREIVKMRFGLNEEGKARTLNDVGLQFGISKERVRQLIARVCEQAFKRHAGRLGLMS